MYKILHIIRSIYRTAHCEPTFMVGNLRRKEFEFVYLALSIFLLWPLYRQKDTGYVSYLHHRADFSSI